jgi:hypothetical protein
VATQVACRGDEFRQVKPLGVGQSDPSAEPADVRDSARNGSGEVLRRDLVP